MTRVLLPLLLLLFAASEAHAKEPKRITVRWNQLPAELQGRKLIVEIKSANQLLRGTFIGHDENGITIDRGRKRGSQTIARRDISSLRASRRKKPVAGRAVGTAVGSAVGALIIGGVLTYLDNEGGLTSGRGPGIAAAAIGIGGGIAALGYAVGDAFDSAPIRVDIPDLVP